MNLISVLAVGLGAFVGAIARWLLGIALNPLLPSLPLGTLAANLAGGFVMGLALGVFAHYEALPIAWRLALTTGFLGGLTQGNGLVVAQRHVRIIGHPLRCMPIHTCPKSTRLHEALGNPQG